jgi:hypothetical protein
MSSSGSDGMKVEDAAGVHQLSVRYPDDHAGTLIAQRQALTRARTTCESSGQAFMPLAEQAGPRAGTDSAEYSLLFRCVARADGMSRQPTVNAPPEPPL